MGEKGLDNEAIAKLAMKQESKVIQDQTNDRRALNQGFSKRATVYFKKNKDSQYHVDSECTKVLIERCEGCTVKINGKVITQTVEVWHCTKTTIVINSPVKTLQLDMCTDLTVQFTKKAYFDSVVWAGLHNLKLTVGEPGKCDELNSGVEQVASTVDDFKENFDQFIVRYVDGKLTQELVVRLDNGFPTTNREADAFDEQQKKNDELFEAHVRKLMDSSFVEKKLEEVTKVDTPPEGKGNEEKEKEKEEEKEEEKEKPSE